MGRKIQKEQTYLFRTMLLFDFHSIFGYKKNTFLLMNHGQKDKGRSLGFDP